MWILQEVHNGTSVRIYCGTRWLPWETYRDVSRAFRRSDLDLRGIFMRDVLEETQEFIWYILCYEGPNALDLEEKDELLDYLAWCQSKRCTDPKDKLYALLGVLPEAIKNHFQPDYSVSVKRVYTDIVEYILGSTRRLDILCHATKLGTHLHNNKYFLPSWIPDWSYQLQVDLVTEICGKYAASSETAQFAISGGLSRGLTSGSHTRLRPQRLEIKAVFVGTIARVGLHIPEIHFIDDILMAFLNWRALIKQLGRVDENEVLCRTMTMDMVEDWNLGQLTEICFHMFAQRLQSDLPHIPLDDELKACSKAQLGISDDALDAFWAKYIERTYENRRLFISEEGGVGLSPPNIDVEDVICVPLGCSTPVILRPWNRGEYKFVCDAYIDGYMYGQADTEWKTGTKDLQTYILV
ncbi:hypothetical protein F5Y10DRAFT_259282 [Nemania abortiva]|nr:hypothetical protein F5Y10DRAFT_259282 [Nemania abortiva]